MTATRRPVSDTRRLRDDPAFVEAAIGDGLLDVANRHRLLNEAEHAGRLTRARDTAAP